MKKEKSIFPLPPDSTKRMECRANLKLNRVLGTEVTATIPMVVLRWALSRGRMNQLRTLCYMKYVLDDTGRGMCDVDYGRMCADLQITVPTIYNHLRVLEDCGFINRDPRSKLGWFLRSWKQHVRMAYDDLHSGLPPKRGMKELHCIFPMKYLGSRAGFKATAVAQVVGQSLRSQERGRRNSQPRIAEKTGQSCGGGALSAQGLGDMLRVSKMQGSKLRRMAVDHGWLRMQYQFIPTPYTRWHLDQMRSGHLELDGVERMRLFGDEIWSEQCPWLEELTRELRAVRRRI